MSLSSDLISRFAKVISKKEDSKKESIQYGTIRDIDGKKYVQLDGSEILTPTSTTVDATEGERVTVLIKNHTATVTGNVTSPSAKQKSVAVVYDTATGAVTIANDAARTASNANTTANTAKDTAESAATAASDAQQAAGNAGQSAENAQSTANNAAKTATNYLYYDDQNGLQVGNKRSGSWVGFRTRMTNTAFEILNAAGTVLASYGANLVELGKNAVDTVIKLCGGKGTISYDSDANILEIGADDIRLKGVELSSVAVSSTNKNSAVNVTLDEIQITSGVKNSNGSWETSEVRVTPDLVEITSQQINLEGDVDVTGDFKINGNSCASYTSGTSGIWKYRKWSDGQVELWGTFTISNIACTTALGNMYRTGGFSSPSFPFTVKNPVVTASYESTGYGAMLWPTTVSSSSAPPSYYLIRPTSATIASGQIHFYVRGTYQ